MSSRHNPHDSTHPSFLDGFVEELHHVHALHATHLELLGPGDQDGLRREQEDLGLMMELTSPAAAEPS